MKQCGHFEIIIIGAGPIGCIAAIELKRLGASVLVLEKLPWDKVKGPFLSGVSEYNLGLFRHFDISPLSTQSITAAPREFSIETADNMSWQGSWQENEGRLFFQREQWDLALRSFLRSQGDEYIDQVREIRIKSKDKDANEISFQRDSIQFQCTADWILCCDGRHSTLAAELDFNPALRGEQQSEQRREQQREQQREQRHEQQREQRLYQGLLGNSPLLSQRAFSLYIDAKHNFMVLAFALGPKGSTRVYLEVEHSYKSLNWLGKPYKTPLLSLPEIMSRCPQEWQFSILAESPKQQIQHQVLLRKRLFQDRLILLGDAATSLDPIVSSGLTIGLQGLKALLEVYQNRYWSTTALLDWERNHLKRLNNAKNFAKTLRFLLKQQILSRYLFKQLQKEPARGRLLMQGFNGNLSYEAFWALQNQWLLWKI